MSEATPLHDWLGPRLALLVHDAEQAGFETDAIVAVIVDILTSPPYDNTVVIEP